ncbi:MAG TPA: epoxyqueuosine reductase [Geobacteraceae bacterium]|nr:epoxyqueuosine reductase [Geobacteraceae bacterium]
MSEKRNDAAKSIREEIARFVLESPANRFPGNGGPYFEAPLVGFASAVDPLFDRYKSIIGEYHLTPSQLMESAFDSWAGGEGTVICWILPIAASTLASNRGQKRWPSREWAYTRAYGEAFNNRLRENMARFLADMGRRAMAPLLDKAWRVVETDAGPSSNWSERHAAFAAGLGTFSLNDGFITEKGMAHRCGSVITDLVLPPTPRPYEGRAEYCLFHRDGTCGACIARCPADAISRDGHDKKKCYFYSYKEITTAVGKEYGVDAIGCGLCQTGVPCESAIPAGKRKS